MRGVGLAAGLAIATVSCTGTLRDAFRPRTLSNNAVHRFFPDLDRRENAIRYGRWIALEGAWRGGISPALDADVARSLTRKVWRLADYPPDALLCAPRFAREQPGAFLALLAADTLESQACDALAAADATPEKTKQRIGKAILHYEASRWALATPAGKSPELSSLDRYATARLLLSGDWLFARSAEDLTISSYAEQRWRIRDTVARFDRTVAHPPGSVAAAWYRQFAPTFSSEFGVVSRLLDRATAFRVELFAAMESDDAPRRDAAVRAVEERYGVAR